MAELYDTSILLWNNSHMKGLVAAAIVAASLSPARAEQPPANRTAQAYEQFLLAHHLEASDDVDGAVAAFQRAMTLDPKAADIPAELAGLYMRQNRGQEALDAAQRALAIDATNREAHRVAGFVYASLADPDRGAGRPRRGETPSENLKKAIEHFEAAIDRQARESDPNVRATLSRLYVRSGSYAKAIPLLTTLIHEEPGWQDGPMLLAEAYAGSGRNSDAIAWLEGAAADDPHLYPTLGDFYEREHRWKDAAAAYGRAVQLAPRNAELKSRFASALLNSGGRGDIGKARDVLNELLTMRPNDARALYLLAQAQRRLGDVNGAEATARRVIAQNSKSPW